MSKPENTDSAKVDPAEAFTPMDDAALSAYGADVFAEAMKIYQQSDMVHAALGSAGYRHPDTEPKLVPSPDTDSEE